MKANNIPQEPPPEKVVIWFNNRPVGHPAPEYLEVPVLYVYRKFGFTFCVHKEFLLERQVIANSTGKVNYLPKFTPQDRFSASEFSTGARVIGTYNTMESALMALREGVRSTGKRACKKCIHQTKEAQKQKIIDEAQFRLSK